MRNYIIFNNFNTSKYALIEELPIVDRPEEDVEFIEIEGRHGYLTFRKGRYKPIEYTVDLVFKGKENRDIIKSKFQGSGNLVLSNEPDRFYMAVVTGVITFERQIRNVYICTISFKLQPFAYETNETKISTFLQPYTLTNHTNTTAQPIIEVYGNGSGILSINNTDIQIREIGECIVLDFELKEAYEKKVENLIVNSNFEYGFENWNGDTKYFYLTEDNVLAYNQNGISNPQNYQIYTDAIDVSDYANKELTLTFEYNIPDISLNTTSLIGCVMFFEDDTSTEISQAVSFKYISCDNTYVSGRAKHTSVIVPSEETKFVRICALMSQNGKTYWTNFQLKPNPKDIEISSKNTQVLTDYEELIVGENVISWSGGITNITIYPNWRWL